VGFPLALAAAEAGCEVVGIDIDAEKIKRIKNGQSPVADISDSLLGIFSGRYFASENYADLKNAEIVVFCLPTPLDDERKPDHSILLGGAKDALSYISEDALVINESTVSPGFTRNEFTPIFQGRDVAYSPERIDPANRNWTLKNTPKLVAGMNEQALQRAVDFYSRFVVRVEAFSQIEVIETAKLLENSFRLINIAFINEIENVCQALNLDVREVIEAASTKPYGFMPFYPSAGAGGHCIPVDPVYLSEKARALGVDTPMINLASSLNNKRPFEFVERIRKLLGRVENKKILVIGMGYKPNVSDIRESPAISILTELRNQGANAYWHDSIVRSWNGENSTELTPDFDMAIIINQLEKEDLKKLGPTPLIYTR